MEHAWHHNDDGSLTHHRPQPGFVLRSDLHLTEPRLREHDAHHEAGHAVVALAWGIPVEYVSMVPNVTHAAHVRFAEWSGPWYSFAMAMVAGEVAGERWLRDSGLATPERLWNAERACGSDRRTVVDAAPDGLRVTFGSPAPSRESRVVDYAHLQAGVGRLLDTLWPQVARLAAALTERELLTGAEVREVIDSTPARTAN